MTNRSNHPDDFRLSESFVHIPLWISIVVILVFAILFLIGAWQLFGQAFWHVDAWRKRS